MIQQELGTVQQGPENIGECGLRAAGRRILVVEKQINLGGFWWPAQGRQKQRSCDRRRRDRNVGDDCEKLALPRSVAAATCRPFISESTGSWFRFLSRGGGIGEQPWTRRARNRRRIGWISAHHGDRWLHEARVNLSLVTATTACGRCGLGVVVSGVARDSTFDKLGSP